MTIAARAAVQSLSFLHEVRVKPHHQTRRLLLCTLGLLVAAACDKDPSRPERSTLTPRVVQANAADSIIGRQDAIRVVFGDSIDSRTALDPENFIVIDRCTGLRVPGALRLSRDTLMFTPSRALPYLTPLSIRVQNVLSVKGRAMAQPFTFSLQTEAPPVADVSWLALDTPTNDIISGISFLDPNTGYLSTSGGAIYKTTNAGRDFQALFKDPDIITAQRIRVSGPDTLFMAASPSFGGTTYTTTGLFRSVNGGLSFTPLYTEADADMRGISIARPAGRKPVVLLGGTSAGGLSVWRYDTQNDSVHRVVMNYDEFGLNAAISPDGAYAAMVGDSAAPPGQFGKGVLYRSTDGGRSFTKVPLPAGGVRLTLLDVTFATTSTAYAVGVESQVYRLDAATGAITRLGAANGIPQSDSTTTTRTFYYFNAVAFAPGGTTGWIVGTILRRIQGQPDVARGIILQTTDGGQNWTRQAVQGVNENGLGFGALLDVSALANNFSATAGVQGFAAIRTATSSQQTGVCSFERQQNSPFQP